MDFPTIFYRAPGNHNAGGALTYDYIGVKDEDRAAELLAEGWFETLPEALEGDKPVKAPVAAKDDEEPSARVLLEAEAKRLGVGFNWKTSDEALADRITEKRGE